MVTVLLLGPARQVAGVASVDVEAARVAEVTRVLVDRFGEAFAEVLGVSRIWIDGQPAAVDDVVLPGAEVSILPPVSGG